MMLGFRWPRRVRESCAPDVIVGIDVGMCFTKVAYTIKQDGVFGDIKAVQDWPKMGGEEDGANYVPTLLGYKSGDDIMQNEPQFVGFPRKEDERNPDLKLYEWFKKDFPGNLSPNGRGPGQFWQRTFDDTETHVLYRAFLAELYACIESVLSPILQRNGLDWNHAQIQFVFSVPATWNRPGETLGRVADSLKMVAKETFEGERRVVEIGMTEPEAAAAYALARHEDLIQSGKSILVVDAGGGTTDLCLLKMQHTLGKQFEIDPLSAPMGEDLGATHIDRRFENLAMNKLRGLHYKANIQREWNFKDMARKMRESPEFQNSKGELNVGKTQSDEFFTVPLPGSCASDISQLAQFCDLVYGSIKFQWSELAKIFDTIIEDRQITRNGRPETLPGLKKLIQRAQDELRYRGNSHGGSKSSSHATDNVSVILMSGGLGQSQYITQRIIEFLSSQEHTFGPAPEVRIVEDPQLCVCKGLLENSLFSIFQTQKCNGNYGVLEYKPYKKWFSLKHMIANQSNHVKDKGGSRYVEEVRWLIKKDAKIGKEPIRSICFLHQFLESNEKPHITLIVSEDSRAQGFPSHGKTCPRTNLQRIEFDERPEYNSKEKRFYCEVELIFNVASLSVNCWSPSESGRRRLIGKYNGNYGLFRT